MVFVWFFCGRIMHTRIEKRRRGTVRFKRDHTYNLIWWRGMAMEPFSAQRTTILFRRRCSCTAKSQPLCPPLSKNPSLQRWCRRETKERILTAVGASFCATPLPVFLYILDWYFMPLLTFHLSWLKTQLNGLSLNYFCLLSAPRTVAAFGA